MEKSREELVEQFQEAFGGAISAEPTPERLRMRRSLIEEEVKELFIEVDKAIELLEKGESVPKEIYRAMLKELADVQVVISGMDVALAPLYKKLSKAFLRVHTSNMTKLGKGGKPILREDGKVLKGPDYIPVDLSDLV
ncbi:MAG: hypothetical protein KGI70_01685 [Patescibacteria group bacterium]|nr:hypothetical protein [Patescibacteria group bacterium]